MAWNGDVLSFVVHHVLNRKWTGNLRKGKYTMRRVMQTILVVLLLLCMAGSMLSGIILSNYVFKFVRIKEQPIWREMSICSVRTGDFF